jgi:sialate O-acetylesterase
MASPGPLRADVRLPGFFGDHMVLQQGTPVLVWGWADPGEQVSVSLAEHQASTAADATGKWSLRLPAMPASRQPLQLTVTASNTIRLNDILVGEVWLCSGQSNMEWSVRQCANAKAEIASASYPLIRHLKVRRDPSPVPKKDLQSEWEVCSPETAGDFTAAGYYTAVNLWKELQVPIGLVNSSWGGTRIEPWTSPLGFRNVAALQELYQTSMQRTPGNPLHRQLLSRYIDDVEQWLSQARSALEEENVPPPSPGFPAELRPLNGSGAPTALYNGMIHPLVGWPIRGVLWYQGEANRRDGMLYFEKKKALVQGWREIWGQGDFPFFIVQIAPFQYGQEDPGILPEFWEAQAATLQLPNTGMVVTNDIATLNDIHPPNKQDVGYRLALLALNQVYGRQELVARSPELEKLEVLSGKLKLTFRHTGGGLKTRDGEPPNCFEIVGKASLGYQPATATIQGDAVLLESPDVTNPSAFRFAWHKLAQPNLTGGTGLPVGAVRAGEVPAFLEWLPDGDTYQLVYDLDLAKLGPQINYDADYSGSVGNFDRIGYLLELDSAAYGRQKIFVSMRAFTDDPEKIAVPDADSGASFQQLVESMQVFSNVQDMGNPRDLITGNIEFWPNNYSEQNESGVQNASDGIYDFGDRRYGNVNGYGCMQVHDFAGRRTLFAINHWRDGENADIGIGNSDGESRDWTFTRNANSYRHKRLRVYVRPQ